MNGTPELPVETQENTPAEAPSSTEIINEPEPNQVVEKTQNDHLNKRLLCSFMEKLNQTQAEPCEDSAFDVENENDEFEDK